MWLGDQLGGNGSPWAEDKDGGDESSKPEGEEPLLIGLGMTERSGWQLGKPVFKVIPGFL